MPKSSVHVHVHVYMDYLLYIYIFLLMVIGVASTDTLSYSVSSVDDSSVSTIQVINATSSSPSKVNNISMTYFTDNTLNATFTTAAESITITDFTATALLTTIHESTQDMIVLSSNGIFSLENSLFMESDLSSETIQLPTTVLNNTSFTVIPSTGTNFLSSTDVLSLFPSTDIETGSDFFGSETMFDTNIYKSSASENNFSSVTASTVTVEANLSLTSEDLMPSVSFTTEVSNITSIETVTISETSAFDTSTVIPTIETSSITKTIVGPSFTVDILPTVTSITQTINDNSSQLPTTEYASTQTDFPNPLTTTTSTEMDYTFSFPLTTSTIQTNSTIHGDSFKSIFSSTTHFFTITDTVIPETNTNSVISSTSISASLSTSISASLPTSISESLPTSISASLPTSILASLPTSISASLPTSISASLPTSISESLPTSILASLPTSISESLPTSISASLPTSISASLPTSISASLPTSISASLPTSISASLPTSISASLPTSISASLPTSISASLPTSISASLPTSISESLPTSISASLPTSISASLSASFSASSTIFMPSTDISSSKTSVLPTELSSTIITSTESTTQKIKNEHQQSQPLPAIIGGVIGCVLTIVLIGSVTLYLWRRQLSCFSGKPMRKSGNGEDNVAFVEEELADIRRNRPVKLSEMSSHFEQLSADSNLLFSQEFQDLNILSPEFPTTDAELQETRLKNRYTNILPFDKTRVKLLPFEDEPGSDYINANYALGFTSAREYIAAQGPLASTINDFWRMIWEQNASIIVMLTQCVERGREKCEEYWPMLNESLYYGDVVVQLESESHLPDFILRTFSLREGDLERKVRHYYYLLWPDMGTPACTDYMIRFVSTIRCDIRPDMTGPIVVHCSAGVGRTGTFITLDTLIRKIQNGDDSIDIFGHILQLRHCRLNMVQTESQYIYIHECIRDYMRPVVEIVNGHDTDQLYENLSMF